MEQLNKQQLILLALLVSFVTSIATGIVTVALMDQAPTPVTQTINRVVEKTIERVVSEPAASQAAAAIVTKETVVVKADDAVIEAIERNARSIVRVKEVTGAGETRMQTFAGLGLVISSDGQLVADISIAYRKSDETGATIPKTYIGVFPDGKIFPLNITLADQSAGIIFLAPLLQDREKGTYAFVPPVFGNTVLKLGQAVIAIGGEEGNAVSTGIISYLTEKTLPTKEGEPPQKVLSAIKTDLRSQELVSGSLLFNLSGEVIGMQAGAASTNKTTFTPIQKILDLLPRIPTVAP